MQRRLDGRESRVGKSPNVNPLKRARCGKPLNNKTSSPPINAQSAEPPSPPGQDKEPEVQTGSRSMWRGRRRTSPSFLSKDDENDKELSYLAIENENPRVATDMTTRNDQKSSEGRGGSGDGGGGEDSTIEEVSPEDTTLAARKRTSSMHSLDSGPEPLLTQLMKSRCLGSGVGVDAGAGMETSNEAVALQEQQCGDSTCLSSSEDQHSSALCSSTAPASRSSSTAALALIRGQRNYARVSSFMKKQQALRSKNAIAAIEFLTSDSEQEQREQLDSFRVRVKTRLRAKNSSPVVESRKARQHEKGGDGSGEESNHDLNV